MELTSFDGVVETGKGRTFGLRHESMTMMEDDMMDAKAAPTAKRERRPDATKKVKKSAVTQLDTHIGKELRQLYSSILEEPIPDRFLNLLQSLEEESQNPKTGGGA